MHYEVIHGDQRTTEWKKIREGKITGSVAAKTKTSGDAHIDEMLAAMTTEQDLSEKFLSESVERGKNLEAEALSEYAKATKQKVEAVGFIDSGRLGISPDGVVFRAKKAGIKKLVEAKCPDVHTHIRYIRKYKKKNQIPPAYLAQIVHGFVVVDDCDEIDFVSYCPDFFHKPLIIITVRRSDLLLEITAAKVAYERFLSELDAAYKEIIL